MKQYKGNLLEFSVQKGKWLKYSGETEIEQENFLVYARKTSNGSSILTNGKQTTLNLLLHIICVFVKRKAKKKKQNNLYKISYIWMISESCWLYRIVSLNCFTYILSVFHIVNHRKFYHTRRRENLCFFYCFIVNAFLCSYSIGIILLCVLPHLWMKKARNKQRFIEW